jgi:hypothetical protein
MSVAEGEVATGTLQPFCLPSQEEISGLILTYSPAARERSNRTGLARERGGLRAPASPEFFVNAP